MLIVNLVPFGGGWNPINHMVKLASDLLEAEVIFLEFDAPSVLSRISAILFHRHPDAKKEDTCLFICHHPGDLLQIFNLADWRGKFKFLSAWIIDSFWIEWIPRSVRLSQPFDHFFITTGEDVEDWKKQTGTPTTWLPWGTDVLRYGGDSSYREWDIIRVGRQPAEWDSDIDTQRSASRKGLRFHPRPDGSKLNPLENQKFLMNLYSRTKYVLAFSNTVNHEKYTHPNREYITGRWVDALGCGAIVAGIPPRGASIDTMLWPGSTLDLGSTRREEGLQIILSALSTWTPEAAHKNHNIALQRLDWRWRFKTLADAFGEAPKRLDSELQILAEENILARDEETQ